jgi:hypothetical protein
MGSVKRNWFRTAWKNRTGEINFDEIFQHSIDLSSLGIANRIVSRFLRWEAIQISDCMQYGFAERLAWGATI